MRDILPETIETPELLERFAAQVAHDFNNLLTGILGNLELMQNRAARCGENGFDGYLEGARNAGWRAARFSQRLLAFSGGPVQAVEPQRLGRVVRGAVHAHGLPAGLVLAAEEALVLCDLAQAELALGELLNNAAEAVAGGGEVVVEAGAVAGWVSICVRDTGCGMAPEVLAHAGEAFFTTRQNGAGRGLGLAIAGRFARQAGGGMSIESTAGAGCAVTLRLPRV